MPTILIVDGHVLFRQGLQSLLAAGSEFAVIGQAGGVQEGVERALALRPDLVLVDINLPDGSGLDVLRALAVDWPEAAVVILDPGKSDEDLLEAMRQGAKGYLPKSTPFASLVAALRGVSRGELALSRAMTRRLAEEYQRVGHQIFTDPNELTLLTAREYEILCLLGSGACNHDIADRLVISEHTVKVHVHHILGKLHLENRAQAAHFARRYGLNHHSLSVTRS